MKARIKGIGYVGWLNLDFEEIRLDPKVLTGFIGRNGTGKSSLAICLCYALLPDRKVLDIRPISNVEDPHAAGIDFMTTLINPDYGYAYAILDIATRQEKRLLAGIHVSIKGGHGEFKRWVIQDVPQDISLQSIMRIEEGDSEYYPDFSELSRALANRAVAPLDIKILRTVGEYGEVLYAAGVLPTDLASPHERSLYAKVIETTFRGGISSEVSTKLKDYLLPPAKRIPDIVMKLQECTDEVLKTRSAVRSADQQLELIGALYGEGRQVAVNALKRITSKLSDGEKTLRSLNEELSQKEQSSEVLSQKLPQLEKEIKIAQESAESVQEAEKAVLNLLIIQVDEFKDTVDTAKKNETEKYNSFTSFTEGGKLWRRLAGKYSEQNDIEWLDEWLSKEMEHITEQMFDIDQRIKQLQAERAALDRSTSDAKTDALAKMVEGRTLGDALEKASPADALAVEMALGSITAGVLGCEPKDIADIPADETMPDAFWIGKEPPSSSAVTEIGEWYVSGRTKGEFIVFSKKRIPVLGTQARQRRKANIEVEIASLATKHKEMQHAFSETRKTRDDLLKNDEKIRLFLDNRERAKIIENEWLAAKKERDQSEVKLKELQAQRKKLQDEISQLVKPYQMQIADLKEQKVTAELNLKGIRSEIEQLRLKISETLAVVDTFREKRRQVDLIPGVMDGPLMDGFENTPSLADDAYLVDQTRRIAAIGRTIEDEPAARISFFQDVAGTDEISCIRLWPILLDILRDRIPAEILDSIGEDMIKNMRERRSHLDLQLRAYEEEVKIEANNIYLSLQSEIRAKQRQIRRLSRLGEDLQFGHIRGIRISVVVREELLDILKRCANQLAMFSKDSRPIEQALADYFSTQMDTKMEGQDLLDYRTYLDIYLEVRRGRGDWERAASLSGGESIGCGLAIDLMLIRSLFSRGGRHTEHMTPLFIIDEANRLDDMGRQMVIEFGDKEGFQVLVTAEKLKPGYGWTLYGFSRTAPPEERIVIRGFRTNDPGQEIAHV